VPLAYSISFCVWLGPPSVLLRKWVSLASSKIFNVLTDPLLCTLKEVSSPCLLYLFCGSQCPNLFLVLCSPESGCLLLLYFVWCSDLPLPLHSSVSKYPLLADWLWFSDFFLCGHTLGSKCPLLSQFLLVYILLCFQRVSTPCFLNFFQCSNLTHTILRKWVPFAFLISFSVQTSPSLCALQEVCALCLLG